MTAEEAWEAATVALTAGEEVSRQHRRFLALTGLSEADCPLLELDRREWSRPFSAAITATAFRTGAEYDVHDRTT